MLPQPTTGAQVSTCCRKVALTAGVVCIFFLTRNHIRILLSILYAYIYWLNPDIHYIHSQTAETNLPVPKLLHQTWKDKTVPQEMARCPKELYGEEP